MSMFCQIYIIQHTRLIIIYVIDGQDFVWFETAAVCKQ